LSRDAIRDQARRRRPHLAIACVVGGLALAPAGAPAACLAAALFATAAGCLLGRRASAIAAALVLTAALAGALRLAAIDRPAHAAPPGSVIAAKATLLERPRPGLHGSSAPMRIDSGPAAGLHILARRRELTWPAAQPGTRFAIRGLVKPESVPGGAPAHGSPASERNAGAPGTPGFGPLPARDGDAFDFAAFLRSRGIGREVEVESLVPTGHRGGVDGLVDAIRRRAETGIGSGLSGEQAALARGMVLGEDGDVADATRDDFRRSGLAHLLAASGQNVALLCALVLPLLMLAGAAQRIRIAVLLPLVGLYVALAGSGASVTRAGIMAAAGLLAIATGRRSSAVYALLLAAALTLALNPRVSGDPGWQLSFAAVVGMLALHPLMQRRLRHLPRPVAEALGASVAATLATSPLLAHTFGAVSIAALPANIVAFPAVAPIMWIGMAEAALEQVGAVAPLTHLVEHALAPINALALRWVAGTATRFADPGWAQATIHLGWLAVAGAYAGIIAAVAAASNARRIRAASERRIRAASTPRAASERRIRAASTPRAASERRIRAASAPRAASARRVRGDRLAALIDWLRALSPASRRAFAAPLVALVIAAAAEAAAPPSPPKHLTVDFIDVGQGDSTLIRDPTGAAVLFDGGVPEARVDRTLKRLGVRKLSVVVATHQSRDHHGGLLQVVKRFPVGLFLDGRYGVDDPSFIALEREVDSRHIPRRPTQAGERLRVGNMTIHVLWPPPRGSAPPPADANTRATVAIISEGAFKLFLSADAESPVDLALPLPRVTAMKVPHHGSADTGLPRLLARLRPRVAAIETGRGNPYGHPTPPTLRALRSVPRVYRTDRDGTVELTVIGSRIEIRTHR
jgi:competence protein ComEC